MNDGYRQLMVIHQHLVVSFFFRLILLLRFLFLLLPDLFASILRGIGGIPPIHCDGTNVSKELLFNRMVSHTLGGLVVAETKTAAAYHLMARWLLIGPVSIPTLLGSFYPPGICRGII